MEVQQVELIKFGAFARQRLEFGGRGRLCVVFGPNEAGKSTARRGLLKLLFGFNAARDPDTEVFGRPAACIRAVLRDYSGASITFERRARRARRRDNGADPDIAQLLHGLERENYEAVFCLDHAELRAGGVEILRSGGRAGPVLLVVAAGIHHADRIRGQLNATARDLYLRKGKNPRINALLKEIEQLQKQYRKAALDPKVWQQVQQECERCERERAAVAAKFKDRNQALARLQREHELYRQWVEYREVVQQLGKLQHVPLIEPAVRRRLQQLLTERAAACERAADRRRQVEQARRRLDESAAALQSIPLADRLAELDRGELEAIRRRCERAEDGRHVLRAVVGQLRTLSRQIRAVWQRLVKAPAGFHRLLLSTQRLAATMSLEALQREQSELDTLRATLTEKQHSLKLCTSELQELRHQLRSFGTIPDRHCLQRQRDQLLRARSLIDELERLLEASTRAESEIRSELRRLEVVRLLGLAELVQAPIWSAEELEELLAARSRTQSRCESLEAQLQEITARMNELRRALLRLQSRLGGANRKQLTELRAHRDQSLRALSLALEELHRDAVSGQPIEPARLRTAADHVQRLQQAVDAVDQAVDAALRDAAELERERAVRDEFAELEHQRKSLEAELRADAERLTMLNERWERLKRATVAPQQLPLDKALAWRQAFRELQLRAGRFADQQQHAKQKVDQLRAALESLGFGADSFDLAGLQRLRDGLSARQEELDRTMDRAEAASGMRGRIEALEAEVGRLQRDVELLEQELAGAEQRLRSRFAEASGVDAPSALEPTELIGAVGQLLAIYKDWMGYRERLAQAVEAHVELHRWLVARRDLQRILRPGNALDRARRMVQEAQRVHELRQQRARLRKDYEELVAELQQLEQQLAEVGRELEKTCAEVGGDDVEAIIEALHDVEQKWLLEDRRRRLENALISATGVQEPSELYQRFHACSDEQFAQRRAELERERDRLREEFERVVEEGTRVRAELQELEAAAGTAARIAQQAEAAAAELEELARQYVVVKLASALFDRLMERYRRTADQRFRQRASNYFRRLTAGRYAGLELVLDRDELVVARRTEEGGVSEPLRVEQLSDGTRDQLFLALRLAAIANFVEDRGPVPVVLDDLLVNFDDQRAMATLEVLGEFAEQTQVIFFTHHRHLVELARRTLGAEKLQVVSLQS